jgi:hypothetical protein
MALYRLCLTVLEKKNTKKLSQDSRCPTDTLPECRTLQLCKAARRRHRHHHHHHQLSQFYIGVSYACVRNMSRMQYSFYLFCEKKFQLVIFHESRRTDFRVTGSIFFSSHFCNDAQWHVGIFLFLTLQKV